MSSENSPITVPLHCWIVKLTSVENLPGGEFAKKCLHHIVQEICEENPLVL
jgi:hypothetical protein